MAYQRRKTLTEANERNRTIKKALERIAKRIAKKQALDAVRLQRLRAKLQRKNLERKKETTDGSNG